MSLALVGHFGDKKMAGFGEIMTAILMVNVILSYLLSFKILFYNLLSFYVGMFPMYLIRLKSLIEQVVLSINRNIEQSVK